MKRLASILAAAAILFAPAAIAQVAPNNAAVMVPNSAGSGGGSPTGAAGGSLTGTYPNPGLNLAGTNTGVLPAANGGFPQGAWPTFTPATASCTGGTLSVAASSLTVGKTTSVSYDVTVATGPCTSAGTDINLGLPNTAQTVGSTGAYEYTGGTNVFCSIKASTPTLLSCRSGANLAATSRFSLSMVYQNQ
jgi:hypothetical protein